VGAHPLQGLAGDGRNAVVVVQHRYAGIPAHRLGQPAVDGIHCRCGAGRRLRLLLRVGIGVERDALDAMMRHVPSPRAPCGRR
jgi:hypothetical protein